jgi:hypothetical protein
VGVAEERALPAAEAVVRDRDRDRDVDPDHADLDLELELAAAPPSRVKIAVPLPYGLSFTSSTASVYVGTRTTSSTGPKISFAYESMPGLTLSRSETPRKKPSPDASG